MITSSPRRASTMPQNIPTGPPPTTTARIFLPPLVLRAAELPGDGIHAAPAAASTGWLAAVGLRRGRMMVIHRPAGRPR
jgi:hypothetical protein